MAPKDLLLVILVCLVWGFNFIAGAKGMQAFSPMLFMVLRFAIVLLATLAFLRLPMPGQWWRLAISCITMGALHFTLLFWALGLSADVTSIVILQNMYIPIAVMLAIFFLGEKAGWKTLAATATAFSGVLIIGFDPLVLAQPKAVVLILGSAFFQAVASVLMRGIHGMHPMNFQAWTAIFCLPLLALLSFAFEENQLSAITGAGTIHWMALAYSAILASLVGHGLFFWLVQRNTVPRLMPYLLMMPLFGAIFGVLVWGDRPGPRLMIGGSIVLLSILLITLRGRRRQSLTNLEPE